MSEQFWKSVTLLFTLLNPFLLSIYMLSFYQTLDSRTFMRVLFRGSTISLCVFGLFAVAGDRIFTDVLQVRFASFLVFGGIVFLLIGLRFVFEGEQALEWARGKPEHIAGSIAMPFMIGPGTISASVLAGGKLPILYALASILLAVTCTFVGLCALKLTYDFVKERNEQIIYRYVDIVGRLMALVIGTIAVEMIFQGLEGWIPVINFTGIQP